MGDSFADILSDLMRERNMQQADLVRLTGISKGAISSYLSGEYVPKQNNTYKIAQALNVDVGDLLQWGAKKRRQLVRSYTINKTVEILEQLNNDGQEVVYKQAELVKASGKYDRPEAIELVTEAQALYTLGTAAAGSGFYNEDYIENYRLIMTTEIPEHDFTLDVEGNSMFPAILDGDVVFVRKEFDRIDNKIYVLDIDGETVVKRVVFKTDKIILKSDNPEWDDREVTGFELERTRIEGRVVGWETPER